MTLSKRYYASTFVQWTFFPGGMHRNGAFELSAIFVSNVIIPGRRPENQPDGLSPTTARSGGDKRRRRDSRERRRGRGKGTQGKRGSGEKKLIARFTERSEIRENSTRVGYSVQSYGAFKRNTRFS